MLTLETLKKEIKPRQGEFVLIGFDVVKLLDVIDDEDDFYWVYMKWGGKIHHHSCVCGWTPLKGKIDDSEYESLEYSWITNEPYWEINK